MQKIYLVNLRKSLLPLGYKRLFVIILSILLAGTTPLHVLASATSASIQSVVVSGKVTDDTGAALPGVNVLEKGTTNGAVTDADGRYTLRLSSNQSVLVFSFVGMLSQNIVVGTQSEVNVQMVSDASTLSEVIVVGYGTQEKKDVTGAMTSVKSEEFNRGIINSPEQLVQGKVAGVNVTSASGEPGGLQSITIRGPGGVRTGSTPLFVVDGLALDNSSTGGSTNPLNFINPQDIESIDVLKDASATAIYGARGANGVILITTKRGKAGRSSLTYSGSVGISKMARPIDVFSADEYREQVTSLGGKLVDGGANTDWQKEISRTAITKNHNIALSGGADKLSYYASLGMMNQEGILLNSSMKRYNGRINVTQKLINDRLNIDLNLSASSTTNVRPPSEGNNGASISILGSALTANPTLPAYDSTGAPYKYANGLNPLRALQLSEDITTINRIVGNISPSFEIIKGLVYKLNYGIDNSNSVRDQVSFPSLIPAQDGSLTTTYKTNTNSLIENYLTYTATKGVHNFSVLAGHSYQKFFIQERSYSINKFAISNIDPRYNPGLGQDLTLALNKPTGTAVKNELQSFFGRVNYAFNDRYLVTATVRADGSSKFGANNKYGTFPSFSLGWRLTEEEFMKSLPISNLKLRAGWGKTGNQEIPPKYTQALFTSQIAAGTTYPLDNTNVYPAGTTYVRLANPDLQWEVSTQTNVGLDFGFLGGALTGSVDYFNKVSSNILLEVFPADPIQPASTTWTNVKDMKIKNAGVEVALNYQYRGNNTFTFNVGGNVTFIHNRVSGSPYSVITSGTAVGSGITGTTVNGYINGEPIGTFFLRQFIGIDETGDGVYTDLDGDGNITDKDRVKLGSALPTVLYNFNAGVGFKGFDLTANFNGVSGNKVFNNTANANFYKNNIANGVNTTPEAVKYPTESISNPKPVSSRYLESGAFLRLNNLTLGYTFSPSMLHIDKWVSALRFSVTGQNLFVITKYKGYDPEVNTDRSTFNSSSAGTTSLGIDYLSYPKARTILFGLNVTF
ncbi:MAG TPA: TonB-dependent receptor [Ohtaekwangia sp.]|uniref:SusC/RagA family TonB-linked outer membrane protein n=1 Tax=Ohtaekwangia sp. TaxID=2066019 RepID=UPI002F92D90D